MLSFGGKTLFKKIIFGDFNTFLNLIKEYKILDQKFFFSREHFIQKINDSYQR